jgi:ABC-type protease/lipase transport system fused ATPase/permease subunit
MAALDKLALLKNGTLEMFGPNAAVLARLRSPAAAQRVVAFPPGKSSEALA